MSDEHYFISTLKEMEDWAGGITGEWDGDFPGSQEDRAHCADEIIAKIDELKELIEEMREL